MSNLLNGFRVFWQMVKEEWMSNHMQGSHTRQVVVERLGNPFWQYNSRIAKEGLVLRFGEFDDLDRIVELERLGYDGFEAWHYHDFRQDFLANPYAAYIMLDTQEPKSQLIGLIVGRFRARGSHISHLIVHPEYQRQGLGSLLLDVWLSCAERLDSPQITLEVRASNQGAQNLYQRHEYKIIGKRERYYQDNGETALIMKRWVD